VKGGRFWRNGPHRLAPIQSGIAERRFSSLCARL
jgi:hypothetical protein